MNYSEMYNAFEEAKAVFSRADSFADKMARMLVGRLRKVNPYVLDNLKKELRDYNSKTKEWKS